MIGWVCKRGNVFSLPVLNRSTGLTIKFARCKSWSARLLLSLRFFLPRILPFDYLRAPGSLHFSGGYVVGVTPVPIPNTEVKPYGADGTARETVWESRSPPGLSCKARSSERALSFLLKVFCWWGPTYPSPAVVPGASLGHASSRASRLRHFNSPVRLTLRFFAGFRRIGTLK